MLPWHPVWRAQDPSAPALGPQEHPPIQRRPHQLQPLGGEQRDSTEPAQRSCAQTALPRAWAATRGTAPGQGLEGGAPDPEAGARMGNHRPPKADPPHRGASSPGPCPLGPVSLLLCSPAWGKSWTRISVKGSMQPSPMKGTHIGEPKVLLPAAKPGVAWKAEGRPGAGRTQHKGAGRVKEDSDLWGLSWGRDGTRNRAAGGRLGSKCPVAIAIHSAKWL